LATHDGPAGAVRGLAPVRASDGQGGAILTIDGVSRRFGGLRAVHDASLSVERGSVTALIGPNGAGKTTLFNIVTGFEAADGGSVRYDGKELLGLPPQAVAARGVARTFQLTRSLAALSVLENMVVAAPRQPGEHLLSLLARRRAVRRREAEIRDRAQELLTAHGLGARAHDYAGSLSTGQRKLLELARALMLEPRLVLLDEPMAGVNRTLGAQLLERIQRLRATDGLTFLFIEHDMEVVMSHADRVIVMAEGQVIASGIPRQVAADPVVVDAYLGRAAP
jgi:branched-chain amino acid transport system ATP-binding protein